MFTTHNTKADRRPADCYCRGQATCENGHHVCTNCTCNVDGAPPEQSTGYGHVNPSQTRLDAWTARQELRK